MKFAALTTTILCFALVAGCDKSICAGTTVWFSNPETPQWLVENDRQALEAIVVNNENRKALHCVD